MNVRVWAVMAAVGLAGAAWAQEQDPQTFHLISIEQVVAGVGGDTSAQAIQLRMRAFGQQFVSLGRLVAWDAEGKNPVVLMDPNTNVLNGDTGDRVLFATNAMKNFTQPPVDPDFVLTNRIPDSYLAAGRITWESNNGVQLLWILAYGGANYTGPTKGTLDNDDDGEFGPPFGGPLPTDGAGLRFQGNAQDKSHSNATDYALTDAPAHLINNGGDTFDVIPPPPGCYPDFTGDGALDLFDFLQFVNEFNAKTDRADCTEDGVYDLFDFLCFVNAFNQGC